MDIFTLICIALSVSADAFTVSVCDGLAYRPKVYKRLAVAFIFGIFQGGMPIIGAKLGEQLTALSNAKNYISFAALFIAGFMMFIDGLKKPEKPNFFGAKTVLFQALATSVDALTCGVSLTALSLPLWIDALVIGGTTFTLCTIGICFAAFIGKKIKTEKLGILKRIAGGALVALAVKCLILCFI